MLLIKFGHRQPNHLELVKHANAEVSSRLKDSLLLLVQGCFNDGAEDYPVILAHQISLEIHHLTQDNGIFIWIVASEFKLL